MIGLKRLGNIEFCVKEILRNIIPGDLIETGVWRGGASIFMRAILKACGNPNRIVWVADSFEGLPKPDGRYQQDAGDRNWKSNHSLGISLERVQANFARYGLLDERVRFLVGWFKDTLPAAPIQQLTILRLDGEMYSSTMDALRALYSKLSPGGYVIVDDYGSTPPCKQAVNDFRAEHKITAPCSPSTGPARSGKNPPDPRSRPLRKSAPHPVARPFAGRGSSPRPRACLFSGKVGRYAGDRTPCRVT